MFRVAITFASFSHPRPRGASNHPISSLLGFSAALAPKFGSLGRIALSFSSGKRGRISSSLLPGRGNSSLGREFLAGRENTSLGERIPLWEREFLAGRENSFLRERIPLWERKFLAGRENSFPGEREFLSGASWSCQELPGAIRSYQELPGATRSDQERPRERQGAADQTTRSSAVPQGADGRVQGIL